jgi:fumarate hydratase subunit beta
MKDGIILNLPAEQDELKKLKAGQMLYINGIIYTARDQAHIRMIKELHEGVKLPFSLVNASIYYCGPTPKRPGKIVGAIGPTTSSRMDKNTVPLLEKGMRVMIGKGKRSDEVVEAIKEYKAVYLCAIGGAGALYANCIKKFEVAGYEDLMSEAIYKLEVENFPAVVAIDTEGNSIFNRSTFQ